LLEVRRIMMQVGHLESLVQFSIKSATRLGTRPAEATSLESSKQQLREQTTSPNNK
jgi:hypothetical protein